MIQVSGKYELYSLYGRGFEDVYADILFEYDKEDIKKNDITMNNVKIISVNSSDLDSLSGPYSLKTLEKDLRASIDCDNAIHFLLDESLSDSDLESVFA